MTNVDQTVIINDCKPFVIYTNNRVTAYGRWVMAKDLELTILFDIYAPLLTEKQRDTLDLYYNEDLSLGEIAETTGTTRQAVMNCIRKSEARLRELEALIGLAERSKEAGKLIGKLSGMISGNEAEKILERLKELL